MLVGDNKSFRFSIFVIDKKTCSSPGIGDLDVVPIVAIVSKKGYGRIVNFAIHWNVVQLS